jgi:hypothetical protein
LDETHGDVHGEYVRLGSPPYPTRDQIKALESGSALPPPEELSIVNDRVSIALPPNGLATVQVLFQ